MSSTNLADYLLSNQPCLRWSPIHTAISVELPAWVRKALIKLMRGFLWTVTEVAQGGKCSVAWAQVQRPLSAGGLGNPDLGTMGKVLWLRWLKHKKKQIAEGCIQPAWHSEDAATTVFFLASIRCTVGNGMSTLFWADPWLEGHSVGATAPDLVAAVNKCSQKGRTVQAALQGNSWIRDITGP
jgi:hypothetical protein